MSEAVVIFRTSSEIEANVVRGLLDAHGIRAIVTSDMTRTVFPLAISGQWELRVSVTEAEAEEAKRLIETHRQDVPAGRVVRLADEFAPLERRIDYRFRDVGLLEHALTHRSRAHEDASGGVFDNESLEFLGDAVLGFVIADRLFRDFPQHDEGRKSKLKSWLVSAPTLAELGERLGLGEFLLLGRGEERSGGRRKQALVADGYEALIAAIHLDGGIDAARAFIEREFEELLARAREHGLDAEVNADYKSALQEWAQGRGRGLPQYRVAGQTGPDHRKRFLVEVWLDGAPVGRAEGLSKKQAAQQAARQALETLTAADTGAARRRSPSRRRQSISMMPQFLGRGSSSAAAAGDRHGRLGMGQPREPVGLHFAGDVLLGRRRGPAVEPHPQPQQRVGEAVALLPHGDQIHVLQPRQVVLRRTRRALEPRGDLGERQGLFDAQDVEDGLERAVPARAVEPELVAEAAGGPERGAGRHERGERADGVRRAAARHGGDRVGERGHVGGPAVGERLDGAREVEVAGRRAGAVEGGAHLAGRQRRHVDDLEVRGRVAQQPVRARHVAGRQDEAVRARRERVDQIAHDACAGRGSSRRS